MSSRIESTFSRLKSQGRMAFMPFVTAGDPDIETTVALIRKLAAQGVDLIEIGFPYSDPIADGPVIQASYTRALANGLRVEEIFAGIRSLSSENEGSVIPPLLAMVSYAIVFRSGPAVFVQQAQESGFSGLIVPDLPGDEADDLFETVKSHGLDLIQLVAPTTTPERIPRILAVCSGFVYCISVAGTTGTRDQLPAQLPAQLKSLRNQTDLPLAVGFGIGKPEQAEALRGLADGVIVGSAIVRQIELLSNGSADVENTFDQIGRFAAEMIDAMKMPSADSETEFV